MATLCLPSRRIKVEAVGLDVDGVLRDTGYAAYLALCATVRELNGTPPPFATFVREFDTTPSKYLPYYGSCGVGDTAEVHPTFLRHFKVVGDTLPYADVEEFLSRLQALQLKVFAVSSHPAEELHRWFVNHGLDDHLLYLCGGSRDKRTALLRALAIVGGHPPATCYVGDWGLDMRAARMTGLVPIGLTRGYPARWGLLASGAAHVVNHLSDLVIE